MLILTRKRLQDVVISFEDLIPLIEDDPGRLRRILAGRVRVCTISTSRDRVRLGFEADPLIEVHRHEVQKILDRR